MLALSAMLAAAPPSAPLISPPTTVILDQNRADRGPALGGQPTQAQPTIERGRTQVEAEATGKPIRGINFGGAKVPAEVAEATRRFIGKPASAAVLGEIAKAMSDAYAKSDVALYTVLVPKQRLDDGEITIRVVEGYVEQVRFAGKVTPLLRAYGTALTKARPLTRQVMERYLTLMRDIPGLTVDVQLLRGSKPGAVILQIAAKRKRKDISIGFDNRGLQLIGEAQARAEAHGYSLLRDGDRTDLTTLITPTSSRLRYIGAAHMTPIGHDGATATASFGYIRTKTQGTEIVGDARTAGLTFAMPVIRGYKRNLFATLGIDGINSDAAYLGATFSADHTRAARAALSFSDANPKAALTAGLTLSRGLDIFGARGMANFTDTIFTKVNARATYDRQIGKRLFGRLRLSGQWSNDRLAGSERFVVGGQEFGRAFESAVLSGDRGAAGLVEFAWRPKLPKKVDGTELYAFTDKAWLHIAARYPYLAGDFDLGSAGAGIRVAFTDRVWLELEGAHVIDRPYPAYKGDWRVNVGWRLALAKR